MARDIRLNVRLTTNEHSELKNLADKKQITMAEYIRDLIKKAVESNL